MSAGNGRLYVFPSFVFFGLRFISFFTSSAHSVSLYISVYDLGKVLLYTNPPATQAAHHCVVYKHLLSASSSSRSSTVPVSTDANDWNTFFKQILCYAITAVEIPEHASLIALLGKLYIGKQDTIVLMTNSRYAVPYISRENFKCTSWFVFWKLSFYIIIQLEFLDLIKYWLLISVTMLKKINAWLPCCFFASYKVLTENILVLYKCSWTRL